MKTRVVIFVLLLLSSFGFYFAYSQVERHPIQDDRILSYVVDPKDQDLRLFWKNDQGTIYHNLGTLKSSLETDSITLVFAMNGGMFNKDHSPQGLYIENGEMLAEMDTIQSGYGNFYMQPNGIFYLTEDKKAVVCTSMNFEISSDIKYATQSGPMLLIDGNIHPKFNEGSPNLHIRNAVGILPNGRILFAMSKEPINFFDLSTYFQNKGCQNALYLDGAISQTYLPEQNWEQLDGLLGPLIGVVK